MSLYGELRDLELGGIAIKELLCAAARLKITRLTVDDSTRTALERLLPNYGLTVHASTEKFRVSRDAGKGGWSNRFLGPAADDASDGLWKLYIASDTAVAADALRLDAVGEDDRFGETLGIPDCCRRFFDTHMTEAFSKQGDLVPLTLRNTRASYPFNLWNNSACQYFGYSLLSYAPCSFNCQASAAASRATYQFLRRIDGGFAARFLEHHACSVLYTEWHGVFLLRNARWADEALSYEGVLATDKESAIAKALRAGNRLTVVDHDAIAIHEGRHTLRICEGEDAGLCVFELPLPRPEA